MQRLKEWEARMDLLLNPNDALKGCRTRCCAFGAGDDLSIFKFLVMLFNKAAHAKRKDRVCFLFFCFSFLSHLVFPPYIVVFTGVK